jgi:hypothetical protein
VNIRWEATVRFHTVAPWQTSVILVAFTLIGLAVSWQRDLLIVATISTLVGIGTAAALLIATYDVLPFTFVFLVIAAAIETCACLNHWLGERWLTAAAADLAVFLATWLVTNPRGLPEGYAPIPATALFAAQMALLVIYLSSVMVRTLLRGRAFTNFETGQCALAFVIGMGGAMRLSSEGSHLTLAIAGFALLCGVACYAISFKVLARQNFHGRNFYTYSTFGILLVLVGCSILLNDARPPSRGSCLRSPVSARADCGPGSHWKYTGAFTSCWRSCFRVPYASPRGFCWEPISGLILSRLRSGRARPWPAQVICWPDAPRAQWKEAGTSMLSASRLPRLWSGWASPRVA